MRHARLARQPSGKIHRCRGNLPTDRFRFDRPASARTLTPQGKHHDAATVHARHSRRRHRRPENPARPDPLPGCRPRRTLGVWQQRRLCARTGRLLEGPVRLARAGSRVECLSAVQGAAARHRPALSARPRRRAESLSAAAAARLARLGLRVPRHHSAADRSRPFRRRPQGCLHRHRAVAARLRTVVQARPETFHPAGHRRLRARSHDQGAWGSRNIAVQGGDWGAGIASFIGQKYTASVCGIHVNLLFVPRDPPPNGTTPEEDAISKSCATGSRRKPATSRSRAPNRRPWRSR